jgi:hypothetical protein
VGIVQVSPFTSKPQTIQFIQQLQSPLGVAAQLGGKEALFGFFFRQDLRGKFKHEFVKAYVPMFGDGFQAFRHVVWYSDG